MALEFIICLLDVSKCDFGELDEAMFQGVERPCEHMFYFMGTKKSELIQVAEVMIQVGEWPL
jgi:hypothetical protein